VAYLKVTLNLKTKEKKIDVCNTNNIHLANMRDVFKSGIYLVRLKGKKY
jgi:hypothetical protein